MLVCWEWLTQYVHLAVDHREMANRFAMSGLNHEETKVVGSDVVIDLEVTSNRGDCLGHIGVAREAAVLLGQGLCIPDPAPEASGPSVSSLLSIENQFPAACSNYTARVIQGVRVGPSPEWLVRRLNAIDIKSVNNVVDVTNYVMMECGQPLHAFDLAQIRGKKIIVRPAAEKEQFLAIDHHNYELDSQMVVIADAERSVALGGVMGGAESEVSEETTDLLIEAALFEPLAIRRAARKLKLQSPSSFRFERRPDAAALDWASRRCCELILEVAGGTLCSGVLSTGEPPIERDSIEFRLNQIQRVLGIEIPVGESVRILEALGCVVGKSSEERLSVKPPSWRSDLTREVDLIEEVARVYGYEKIPEDVLVPLGVAAPRHRDIVLGRVRHTLSAFGIDEAMTASVVNEKLESCGSVWTQNPPLSTETPLLVGSRLLRRSLLPSLLAARFTNQTQSIRNAQLYEIANVILAQPDSRLLPVEQSTLGIVTAGDLRLIKGIVEEIVFQVGDRRNGLTWSTEDHPFFKSGCAQRVLLAGETLAWFGLVHKKVQDAIGLDAPCAAAELNIDVLTQSLVEVRRADPVSPFPAISRDLNFIVDEQLRWAELEAVCRSHGGEYLNLVSYQETYRDPKKDGEGKKRLLLTLQFQSLNRTLTGDEIDQAVAEVIAACAKQFDAKLLG